ncbi:hypothetical protein EV175_000942 [Coemansia sp. RSA 1933]|nr:hypothetical protein EV175_000942 [Coemansia sp. RSA 1933]
MLPSRNRLQAKKILPNSRSVVLSSAPVLNKDKQKNVAIGSKGKGTPVDIASGSVPSTGTTHFAAGTNGASNEGGSASDGAGALDGQQYTYVTDDSGYTWLYDTVYGQYYYYDSTQATYVPYGQQGVAGSSSNNYHSDMQTHTPVSETPEAAKADASSNTNDGDAKQGKTHNKRRTVRLAGGQVWEDSTLDDWPTNDYRLFAGNLGPEVTSDMLQQAFGKFRTLQRAHVVTDKKSEKSRGYGFLSFGDADDFLAAWKEFNGKYVGSRPINLRKSTWKERNVDIRKVKRVEKRAFLQYKHYRK